MKKNTSLNHYRLNFRLGMFSFLTHRITGVILVFSGIIMLLGLSLIMFGPLAFDELLITLKLPFFVFLAHFLAITLFWHILNGVKIILIDVFMLGRIQEILTLFILLVFIIGVIIYFVYVFPSLGVA